MGFWRFVNFLAKMMVKFMINHNEINTSSLENIFESYISWPDKKKDDKSSFKSKFRRSGGECMEVLFS